MEEKRKSVTHVFGASVTCVLGRSSFGTREMQFTMDAALR
jgi:hypothetical protein